MATKTLKNQEEVKEYSNQLMSFYKQLGIYVIVNSLFILYWFFAGESYFWPIWVILGWGTPLFFVALDLEILPAPIQKTVSSIVHVLPLPFLKPKWQAKQVDHFVKLKTASSSILHKEMAHKSSKPMASKSEKVSNKSAKASKSTHKKAAPKAVKK